MATLKSKSTLLSRIPSEESCKKLFIEYRFKSGIKCPICGCEAHYWLPSNQRFKCKNCSHRQTLKANTVMENSKLPFRYWFIAMKLITSTKNSFSAAEVQRQIGHSYYRPIWNMMHKIREALGIINENVILKENVEIDEAFFSTRIQKDKIEDLKQWQGENYKQKKPFRLTKTKVLVACEAIPVIKESKQSKRSKIKYVCGKLRMNVVQDFKRETIRDEAVRFIDKDSILRSDATKSHSLLPDIFKEYIGEVIEPEDISKKLPFVHIAIGNLKALIRNVHHSVKREYLQFYINDFVWKFNNRGNITIERLIMDLMSLSTKEG